MHRIAAATTNAQRRVKQSGDHSSEPTPLILIHRGVFRGRNYFRPILVDDLLRNGK